MTLLSLIFAESPAPPFSVAGTLTLKLPLSEALVVHAEKLPLSKPSLNIKSVGTAAVRVGVKVAVLVEEDVAVDGMGEVVPVLVGVKVSVLPGWVGPTVGTKVDVFVDVCVGVDDFVGVNVVVWGGVLVEVLVEVPVGVNGNGVLVDPAATTVPPPKSSKLALPAFIYHNPIYPPFAA